MDAQTIDWRLLQAFLAAAETGSLGAAARALGESQPTLSRRLAQLETGLGQALFERTPRGLTATAAGAAPASSLPRGGRDGLARRRGPRAR